MSDELKPCPFCGGSPKLVAGGVPGCNYVVCESCRATSNDGSRERTIAAWNRRTPTPVEEHGDE